jgi:hypothetical protein
VLSALGVIAAAAVGGIVVFFLEKAVTPVLRRLPRSEHLGRSGSSSGGHQFANAGYDGGGSCDPGSSSSSDGGGGSC